MSQNLAQGCLVIGYALANEPASLLASIKLQHCFALAGCFFGCRGDVPHTVSCPSSHSQSDTPR
jgi:hypothetical protein